MILAETLAPETVQISILVINGKYKLPTIQEQNIYAPADEYNNTSAKILIKSENTN